MSKKNKSADATQVNGHDRAPEIPVPDALGSPSGQASDDQLAALQDKVFGEKTPAAPAKESPPAKVAKSGKDRAREIFDRAQGREKKEESSSEEEPVVEDDLEMIDTLSFLTDESTPPKDDGEEEEENIRSGEEEDDEQEEEHEEPNLDKENNIKALRQSAKSARTRNTELETEIASLKRQLQEQPGVSGLQAALNQANERVKNLEQYETIFALHENPEFKTKFIDGSKNIVGEMKVISKDYGVDETLVDEFLTITNRREMDEFLTDNFDSAQARQDLKALKQRYDGLQTERRSFEKTPGEALSQFESQKEQRETSLLAQREAHLERIRHEGWSMAVSKNAELPNDKKIYELVEIPGKKDHNEKVVRPTLNAANQLLNAGLNHIETAIRKKAVLSPRFVEWFSTLCQQAAASQMIHASRLGLHRKYQEMVSEKNKNRSMERPGLSTGTRTTAPARGKKSKDGKDVAADIFESVMNEAAE